MICLTGSLQARQAEEGLPQSSDWAWLYTAPVFDGWDISKGKAVVTVDGTNLSAQLFDGDHPTILRFTATGTLQGHSVSVRVVTAASDASSTTYSGQLITRRFTGFADYIGVQTILLTDQAEHQLALTRTLRRSPPPPGSRKAKLTHSLEVRP